ncbi:MAG: asparagine synthetase B, partial [Proteobacteria bacterium]|nr:asparagine synthetase B [Pseudomonadota bacterium]
MCGICGKLNFNKDEPVDPGLIRQMCQILSHRGPDDEGMYVQRNCGLGHRRLSIIDLTAAGHQPMCNEDGTIWIVFNGEIYNFLE